ncbi:MAG: hypothetical protein ACPGJV_13230 [Bacteriovoracaceae bacterium]
MEIFSQPSTSLASTQNRQSRKNRGPEKAKRQKPQRKNYTPEEIRARVRNNIGDSAKNKRAKLNSGKQVSSFMSDNNYEHKSINKRSQTETQTPASKMPAPKEAPAKVEAAEAEVAQEIVEGEEDMGTLVKEPDHLLESDIKLNDPNDPTTVEKLKDAINSGVIKFSEKERAVLGKIIASQ